MPTEQSANRHERPLLSHRYPKDEAANLLRGRIDAGQALLTKFTPSAIFSGLGAWEADISKWGDFNSELLRALFTTPEVAGEYSYANPILMRANYDNSSDRFGRLRQSVEKQLTSLESILDKLTLYEVEAPTGPPSGHPGQPAQYRDVHIHIAGSTVGQLNLAPVVGNIETHLNTVNGPTASELKVVVANLVEAVVADEELSAVAKKDTLENIDYLSEAAATPVSMRKLPVVKAVVASTAAILAASSHAATVWEAARPVLQQFFGF